MSRKVSGFDKIRLAIESVYYAFLLFLPNEFSKYRVRYYNRKGCEIHEECSISPNVRIRGKFKMEKGSSIAYNCSISGGTAGVSIGKNVMIAPNVVIVAFNHGFSRLDIPMVQQRNVEASVMIGDDVWIGANSTVGKGVTIGQGAIVGANTLVNKNVPPFCIVGGVPCRIIGRRHENA